MDSNEVIHWGIQGQKWGKRRWQNPDGSLTEEGRERYYGSKRRRKVRRAKDLSEDELRQAINRLNLEKTYYDSVVNEYKGSRAVEQVQHPLKSLGKYAIDDLSNEVLRPSLIEAGRSTIKDIFRRITEEGFDTRKREREKLEKELAKREEEAEKSKKEAAEALKITPSQLDNLAEVSDATLAATLNRIRNENAYKQLMVQSPTSSMQPMFDIESRYAGYTTQELKDYASRSESIKKILQNSKALEDYQRKQEKVEKLREELRDDYLN